MRRIKMNLLTMAALVALLLIALQPFFRADMIQTDDGLLHLYRSVALDHSLNVDGALYPRYSSGLVYGYGAALFNYFPPSSYYPTVLFHRLGLAFVPAWLMTMAAYTLLAGLGAYLLGKQWANRAGGLVTAVAYVYSPYFLFDTVTRGTSSETAALALLPFVLWAFTRLSRHQRPFDLLLAAGSYALFIVQHNIIALHGTLFIMCYALLLVLLSTHRIRSFVLLLIAGIIAFGLSAFFWLPALGETDAVKINAVAENLNFIDVTRSLRPLADNVALPQTADPTRLNTVQPVGLGLLQLGLLMTGLLLSWRDTRQGRKYLSVFLLLVVLFSIFLNTPASAIVWDTVPLIGYSQFAWRILGIPSLALALAAGIATVQIAGLLRRRWHQGMVYSVTVMALMIYAIPWTYSPSISVEVDSVRDAQAFERDTQNLTISSYSEYLPVWNETPPEPESMTARFEAGDVVPRLQDNADIEVFDETWQGTSAQLSFRAAEPTRLVFDWLYMPGWEAHFIDEAAAVSLTVRPYDAEGFVSVEVPAGEHTLVIEKTETDLQQLSWIIAAVSAGLLLMGLVIVSRFVRAATLEEPAAYQTVPIVVMGVAGVLLLGIKVSVIDGTDNRLHMPRFDGQQIAGVENATQADFGDLFRLLGISQPESVKSGDMAQIQAFWTVQGQGVPSDYSSIVSLVDDRGHVVADVENFMPGNLATRHWRAGFYVVDTLTLQIPADTPPNDYTLRLGLYDPVTLASMDVMNEAGNPISPDLAIGQIRIERPDEPPALPDDTQPLDDTPLIFHDVDGIPAEATTGDAMTFSWLWQAVEAPLQDYQARLVFVSMDATGATQRAPLVHGLPTSDWRSGDQWRGHHTLYVPAELSAGSYDVQLQLLVDDETVATVPLDTMQVRVPERRFTMPDDMNPVEHRWSNGIQLIGENVTGPDDTVTRVTLTWEVNAPIDEYLRLFVHLVDENGTIAAVSDGVPVNWTRPTTGWIPDEVIVTEHDFSVPAGQYDVIVGWYEPLSQQRISLPDGGDALALRRISVE